MTSKENTPVTTEEKIEMLQNRILDLEAKLTESNGQIHAPTKKEIARLEGMISGLLNKPPAAPPEPVKKEKDPIAKLLDGDDL